MRISKVLYRVFAAVIFLALLCGGYRSLNRLFMNKTGVNDTINSFYQEEKDSCDVLFVGSSHAYRGFSPMELWNSTGITSYTLATPAQPVAASYYLIKEGIRTQHPKLIVFEMYGLRYEDDFREENLHNALDGIPLGTTKWEIFNDYLKEKVDWETALTFLFPMLLYHQRWDSLSETDYEPQRTFLKGYQYTTDVLAQKKPKAKTDTEEINEEILEYLDRIITLCKENDTQLLLVGVPLAKAKKNTKSLKRFRTAAQYAAEKGVPSIIMNDYADEIGIDFTTDFYEKTHLNAYGGKKVTLYLGEYMKENYALTDHRDDPAYESWNDAYREYEVFVEEWPSQVRQDEGV